MRNRISYPLALAMVLPLAGCPASTTLIFTDGGNTSCGSGTILAGSECVVADAGVVSDGEITCGAGTVLAGTTCVAIDAGATSVSCGPGTTLMGGACVAVGIAYYDVRVPFTTIPGDGYSKIQLTVLGRNADGTPATDAVVLRATRPGAGSIQPSTFQLGETPSTAWFTSCSTASSLDCAGDFQIVLALASDPTVVLAQTPTISIIAPTGVGTTAPCLAGGNAVYFSGDPGAFVFSGATKLITTGRFTMYTSTNSTGDLTLVHVDVVPSSQADGQWWDTYFSSEMLGQPLMTTVYDGAARWPFEANGQPGFDISGNGLGCNEEFGRFQIETLTTDATGVVELLATFEQHCDSPTAPALRGCVRYVR